MKLKKKKFLLTDHSFLGSLLFTTINACLFFFLLSSSLSFHITQISSSLFPSVSTPFLLFGTEK